CTRSRAASEMFVAPASARAAVLLETPACAATSMMVGRDRRGAAIQFQPPRASNRRAPLWERYQSRPRGQSLFTDEIVIGSDHPLAAPERPATRSRLRYD